MNHFFVFALIPLILSLGITSSLQSDILPSVDAATEICGLDFCANYPGGRAAWEADLVSTITTPVAPVEEESMTPSDTPVAPVEEESMTPSDTPISLLFVQTATSGTFTPTDDGYTLTLEGITPQTIYFSDRPDRITGHMTTGDFVNSWAKGNDSFASDPPNAAITILNGLGTEDNYEITNY